MDEKLSVSIKYTKYFLPLSMILILKNLQLRANNPRISVFNAFRILIRLAKLR